MKEKIVQKLLDLNREFYQTFASQFSATRMRIQPGVKQVMEILPKYINILDLGCGNGQFALALAHQGHQGHYLGLDFSPKLLDIARTDIENFSNFSFIQGDLASQNWDNQINSTSAEMADTKFNAVLAFATFHHLPGSALHMQTLKRSMPFCPSMDDSSIPIGSS